MCKGEILSEFEPSPDAIKEMVGQLCFWLLEKGKRGVELEGIGQSRRYTWWPLMTVCEKADSFDGFVRRHAMASGFQTKQQLIYYSVVYAGLPDGTRALVYQGRRYSGPDARNTARIDAVTAAQAFPLAVQWMIEGMGER